ncbi:Crp/Fnr family transcriptional regulator [Schinkia azotoformans]|uniref:CarD family transcriptional regulator n=1 Tax=Schinkia azotoformans LMG 9581 TaxID=1131731 RepID=K6C9J2_SCHAZ|nr:Crp/Fnr family transcriptional regulator [Schinkia azotoformans]EKN67800.1 CarD family transcriptional regulator [Schinkia azotoformans LMG 9581]MEC1637435.1 Crp/Fnr family transcriptional regulator [Schinkia azotoformans]MEC1943839.1 Crp/Fnr family transcriptional regulator [Schinkia azotoformans]
MNEILQVLDKLTLSQTPFEDCFQCLDSKVIKKKYSRGEVIISEFEEGRGVFFIHSGLVKLTKLDKNGKELIVSLKTRGDIITESGLFNKREYLYTNTATMIHEGEILYINTSLFEAELKACPLLIEKVIQNMGEQIEEFSTRLFERAYLDIYSNLLITIEKLSKKFGRRLNNKIYIDLPISVYDLSLLVGATRESTSRALSKLKSTHLIELKEKRIIILDWNKFSSLL